MARSVSKEAILDAAEAMVNEVGAAHMTLDGVAERALVSKGGLMYSFPSKAALLQGMIRRQLDRVEELRERIRAEFGASKASEIMVEIKLMSRLDESASRPSTAMLAAVANQPELMEPFREELRQRVIKRLHAEKSPERSTILYLAALGLHFSDLLCVPFLDEEQRKVVYEHLLRLASNEKEKL